MGRVFRVTILSGSLVVTARVAQMMKLDLWPHCPLVVKLQYPKGKAKVPPGNKLY